MRYYLVGIGGTGMSSLAQVLAHKGHTLILKDCKKPEGCEKPSVCGSDRDSDFELQEKLKGLNIKIFNQDGSGINQDLDRVIVSRAIEDDNPDLVKARKLNICVSYRQDVLKELFRLNPGIAVAGTSGKTTVVGMIGSIFDAAGKDLTIINGGIIKNYNNNIKIGKMPYYCIETDESEGDLKGFCPEIGVLTNIGPDHMTRGKLVKVYEDFADEVKDILIINEDSKLNINRKKKITYSIYNNSDLKAADIELFSDYSLFKVDNNKIKLSIPGLYNIYNALAAFSVAKAWGVSISNAICGLEIFKGIKRRFDIIGEKNGVRVIDDYAHNPDKIKAAIDTARLGAKRIIAIYQPHGYKPTRMFFDELVDVFVSNLGTQDFLFMPEIYYAGGKVLKDVLSSDVIEEVKKRNGKINAKYFAQRNDIIDEVRSISQPGDTILIMGARDRSLSNLAQSISC